MSNFQFKQSSDSALILFKKPANLISDNQKKVLSAKLLTQYLIVYEVKNANQTGYVVYASKSGQLSWLLDDELYDEFRDQLDIKLISFDLKEVTVIKKLEIPSSVFGRWGMFSVARSKKITY